MGTNTIMQGIAVERQRLGEPVSYTHLDVYKRQLFTLMMNYVAVYIIQYLREGPWINPANTGFPQIARFDTAARLPKVFGVHIGWIVALVLVLSLIHI